MRASPRRRARAAATITATGIKGPVSCVVWNISDTGAHLTAAHAKTVPEVFTLCMAPDASTTRFCHVVWRKPPHIGVRFVSEREAEAEFVDEL